MRLIIEDNIENTDFIEIIVTQKEWDKMLKSGLIGKFKTGFHERPLNVFIREESRDYVYEDEYEE